MMTTSRTMRWVRREWRSMSTFKFKSYEHFKQKGIGESSYINGNGYLVKCQPALYYLSCTTSSGIHMLGYPRQPPSIHLTFFIPFYLSGICPDHPPSTPMAKPERSNAMQKVLEMEIKKQVQERVCEEAKYRKGLKTKFPI